MRPTRGAWRAEGDDLAVIYEGHPVAEPLGLFHDDGQVPLLTAGEVTEVRAPFRVEPECPQEMVGISGRR